MKSKEDIRDIFSILHDGTISAWEGNKDFLILTIDCEYLAERINKSFDKFYLELSKIDMLQLDPWVNPLDIPQYIMTNPENIFQTEFEILSADIKEDAVIITCNQHNTDYNYCGGNLTISCVDIKVYDQDKNLLTIDTLGKICDSYWNEFP